jgi:hypothetical protein
MRFIVSKRNIIKRKILAKKPKPLLYPVAIETQYAQSIRRLMSSWVSSYNTIVLPRVPSLQKQYKAAVALDSWEADLNYYLQLLSSEVNKSITFFKSEISLVSSKVAFWNKRQWDKHVESAIGKSIMTTDSKKTEIAKRFIEKETTEISSLAQTSLSKLKVATLNSLSQENRPKIDFLDMNKRSKQIALGISSFNTELYKEEQTSIGIDEYTWRTMTDERVRQSHRPLEGMICLWSDPTVFKFSDSGHWISRSAIGGVSLHPGEDFNCRCYPEARFSLLI